MNNSVPVLTGIWHRSAKALRADRDSDLRVDRRIGSSDTVRETKIFRYGAGRGRGASLRLANYSANTHNQYTSRTVPDKFDVLGIATASSSVTVNSSAADYRSSEYFQELVTVNNSANPVWQSVRVTTSDDGSSSGNLYVPKGNLTGLIDATSGTLR